MQINIQNIYETLQQDNLLQEVFGYIEKTTKIGRFRVGSKAVERGDVFICIRGFSSDGHDFAGDAVKRGAVALIVERFLEQPVPQFRVSDCRKAAALMARLQFEDPTSKLTLIGVTGTNGKTTQTHLIEHILRTNGYKVGMIGTLGHTICGEFHHSDRTTPDIFDLNAIFANMVAAGVTHVTMEVSSHALSLHRVYGLHFKTGVFINLTRDHIDFHGTMENYREAKYTLFEYLARENGTGVFNLDDETGTMFYERYSGTRKGLAFGRGDYPIENLELGREMSRFTLAGDEYAIHFIGRHNVLNAALAIAAVRETVPLSSEQIQESLQTMTRVPGRLDRVPNDREIGLYIDYGHTDDALRKVLSSLREIPHRRLLCVFGAGGDRDHGKRPMMASAVLENVDTAIVTTDNPRTENPDDIIRGILSETPVDAPYWVLRDRRLAIQTAVDMASAGDIVLLAGKGHEDYQEVAGKKFHFNDQEEAQFALQQVTVTTPEDEESSTIPVRIPIDSLMLEFIYGKPAHKLDDALHYVSTDSRTVCPHSLYFALSGERFDGHDFLSRVLQYDSVCAVVSRPSENPHTIMVDDTTHAYLQLAKKYLSLFGLTRIAVTGSVGKTSVKEMLYNVLAEGGQAARSHANENNRLGLCRTIFRLTPELHWGVFELGTNHPGEIAEMAELLNPEAALITSVGASHLEFFGSLEGVFAEKTSLFAHTRGMKVYPGDNPLFRNYRVDNGVSFGLNSTNDFHPENIRTVNGECTFTVRGNEYTIPTDIPHQLHNAVGVIALCLSLGIPAGMIRAGLKHPLSGAMRMEICEVGTRTVIVDCYNANPDSMKAALSYWAGYQPSRPHAAILGDMLELGGSGPEMHRGIAGELEAAKTRLKTMLVAGVGMLSAFYTPDQHYGTVDDFIASDWIETLPENAVVLIKGSHGIHLEKTLPVLESGSRPNFTPQG